MLRFIAVATVAALAILTVYLALEIRASNNQLATTQTTLASVEDALAATTERLQDTDVALAAQKNTNTTLQSKNAGLEGFLADALDANAEFAVANDGLKAENADLAVTVVRLTRQVEEATALASGTEA